MVVLLLRVGGWLLGMWMCGMAAHAQDAATGALRGEVDAPDGHAVADADVTLRGVDGQAAARTVRTGADGRYALMAVEPGRYTIQVEAGGFARDTAAVTVVLGETAQVDVILRVGVEQSVSVDAQEAVAADAFVSAVDTTVRPEEVRELPIEGRRWQDLAVLAPRMNAVDAEETQVSAAGVAVVQNRYTLDGVRDGRVFSGEARGGRRLSLGVAQSGVREFRVVTSAAGSEWNRVGGALEVVTRRGGARRGGSAFVQERSNLWAATDPAAMVTRYNGGLPTTAYAKPQDTRVQWGATMFGALPRLLRVVGHVAYEGEHRGYPAVSSPAGAKFYALSAKQVALLQTRGVAVARQKEALAYLDSLTGEVKRRADEWSVLPRLDWDAGKRAQMSVVWNHASRVAPAGLRSQTVVNRGVASFGNDRIATDAVIGRWAAEMSHRMVNRVSVGYSRDVERQEAQAALEQEPHTGPNGLSPQVSIGSDFVYGKPNTLGRRRYPNERRVQADEAWSYAGRGWAVQAGGGAAWVREQISSLNNEEGTYSYANSAKIGQGGALVDWISDWAFSAAVYPNGACPAIFAAVHTFCFRSFTQSFGAESIAFSTGEMNGYVLLRAQPFARMTVTAGARYEVFRLPGAQQPNAALDALFGEVATTRELPRDANNVGPFAAVAWSAGRTVVRAGAGVSYGRLAGATVWSALTRTALPGSVRTIRLTPQTVVDAGCSSAGSTFGYPATYVCLPSATTLRTTSAVMFARDFAMPAIGQAELSVERQVGRMRLSATYAGFAARSLPNSTDINIARSGKTAAFRVQRADGAGEAGVRNGDAFVLPVYTARVNANFGPVTEVISNASASHHSLSVAMDRRLRGGWSMRAAWTYAKTLDFGQNQGALPLLNGQLDPFNVRYDRALSDLDRRHRVVFAGFYTSKVAGAGWRARVMKEWTVAPMFSASSGRPYSYLISGGTSLSGGADSINGAGGLRYLPSVGRNTLRLPWSETLNVRVARRFALGDGVRVQVHADGFNVMNANNVSRVQQRAFLVGDAVAGVTPLVYQDAATVAAEGLTTQAFGTRMGTGTLLARQREFQFGLRLEW